MMVSVVRIADAIQFGLASVDDLAEQLSGEWAPSGQGCLLDALLRVYDAWIVIQLTSYLSETSTGEKKEGMHSQRDQLMEAIHQYLVPLNPDTTLHHASDNC